MDITEAIAWEDLAVMWVELEAPPEAGNEQPDEEDDAMAALQAEELAGAHADR